MKQWILVMSVVAWGSLGSLGCDEVHSQTRTDVGPDVVATIDGTPITADRFRDKYLGYLMETGLLDAPQRRSSFLERLVSMHLLIAEQRADGIGRTEAYQYAAERTRRKLLIDGYMETVVYDTLNITQGDLEAMFVRMNTQLEARHLYARTREQADALYARVQAGETFEDLAREVFVDEELAASGGSVGTFGFDEMDPAFEDAAYNLAVGNVSPPIRTALGYSIIRLDDRITKPLLTETEFAEKKDRVELYVRQRQRNDARRVLTNDLYDALDLRLNDAVAERLLGIITGESLLPDGEDAEAWRGSDLFTFVGDGYRETWTVQQFLDVAQYAGERQREQVRDVSDIEALATGLVVQEALLMRAEKAGVEDLADYEAAFAAAMNDWVFEQAYTKLAATVPVADDSIRAYFEQYADEFVVPQQLRVREIVVDTKAEAERLRAQLATTDFAALAAQHSVRPGADATGGDLGYVTQAQLGVLGAQVFAAEEGAVIGPLEVGGRYALFEIGDRTPARPATLDEVAAEITKRLQRENQQAFMRTHTEALRDRFPVVRYPDVVQAVRLRREPSS